MPEKNPSPGMEEGLLSFLRRRYFPDKVIDDFDFLNLFAINLVYLAYQNPG